MRIIMICILLLCIATPAEARTRFGTEDKIIRIQKIEVPAAARPEWFWHWHARQLELTPGGP